MKAMRKENQKYHTLRFKVEKPVDITLKNYEGFRAVETGSIIVDYKKEGFEFLHSFKFVLLERYAHNDFFNYPYLVVCFALELEGMGKTKDEAFKHLHEILEFYVDGLTERCINSEEHTRVIMDNMNTQNYWKDYFGEFYKSLKGS